MNTFQITILGIFAFFLLMGFLIFAGIIPLFQGGAPSGVGGTVVVWGTLPGEYMDEPLRTVNQKNKETYAIEYKEIRPENFDRELIEALASGTGPDVLFLPQDLVIRHQDKVSPIPYESLSARVFQDAFVEEGELYLSKGGALALPIFLDPLVMYWNRDLFSAAGIAQPPKKWEEFFGLVTRLTTRDEAFNIRKSAVAFGEMRNVTNAKDIVSMLILQAGNPIIEVRDDVLNVVLQDNQGAVTPPAQSSVRFYTEFSNPARSTYSWNRALPQSKDFFTSGDLALYFGYASEFSDIRAKSPHLNFDVSIVPQPEGAARHTTLGKVTGAAVLKASKNQTTAYWAVYELSGKDFAEELSRMSGLPPARRDLLASKPTDAAGSVFYDSALIARAWLDPNPQETSAIFTEMIENVVSGRSTISDAVSRAHRRLLDLLGAI